MRKKEWKGRGDEKGTRDKGWNAWMRKKRRKNGLNE